MLSFFWSVFSRIWAEYGKILRIFPCSVRISPYSVRMRVNTDQKKLSAHNQIIRLSAHIILKVFLIFICEEGLTYEEFILDNKVRELIVYRNSFSVSISYVSTISLFMS